MSRWSYGDWAMAAVAIDEFGDICPLSEVANRTGFGVKGYYEQKYFWGDPSYYRMDNLTGEVYSKYEGSFTIEAHVQVTDKNGGVNTLFAECDGYTCCGEDCFMLLVVGLGNNAASTTLEFQVVDRVELEEAVGSQRFSEWYSANYGKSTLVNLDGPTF